MGFGERLQLLRSKFNMTQKQLADKLDIKQQAISSYEQGLTMPKNDVIIKISKIFNISIGYLMGVTENPYDNELPDDAKELLKIYGSLPFDKKNISLEILRVLKDTSENEV